MNITGKILKWKDCPPVQFVRRWESLAQGSSIHLYERHPGTRALNRANLRSLYTLWKEDSRSLNKKEFSLLAQALPEINSFRAILKYQEIDVLNFYDQLTRILGKKFSLKIFALHVAAPRVFPPFSPPRLKAFLFLSGAGTDKESRFSEALLGTYFQYQKFFFELTAIAAADTARIDRALLAFGQFLDRYRDVVEN